MNKKYDYNTQIKFLPKRAINDIWKYVKEGWKIYEREYGEESPDVCKKETILNDRICDIEDQYPVDTLVKDLNAGVWD